MIRAVTYDCWRTVLHDRAGRGAMDRRAAVLAEVAGIPLDVAKGRLRDAFHRHDAVWRAGRSYTARDMAAACLDGADGLDVVARAFEEATGPDDVFAVPGAVDALRALKDRGIRTALVCDTGFSPGRQIRALLDAVGLLDLLDVQVFSDEVGVPKPAAAMFAAALDPLGVAPGEAAHVGDLRRTDVAGARAYGLATVRFRGVYDDVDAAHPEADHVVAEHAEVLTWISGDRP